MHEKVRPLEDGRVRLMDRLLARRPEIEEAVYARIGDIPVIEEGQYVPAWAMREAHEAHGAVLERLVAAVVADHGAERARRSRSPVQHRFERVTRTLTFVQTLRPRHLERVHKAFDRLRGLWQRYEAAVVAA